MAAILPVALQMYTVRDDAARDFAGTLARVAAIGYSGVELGGYPGRDAAEVRGLLDANGLAAVGTHVGLDTMAAALSEAIAYGRALGARFLTCPYLPEEKRRTLDDYRAAGRVLRDAARRAADDGVTVSYHHHDFEFALRDGEGGPYALDVLLDAAGPEVGLELDTFWVAKGGEDPAAYLRRYAGRVHLVHLKDMTGDDRRTFAEVGEGVLDWPAIFAAADESGSVRHYIVEQDLCYDRTPLESARVSLDHLRLWGRA